MSEKKIIIVHDNQATQPTLRAALDRHGWADYIEWQAQPPISPSNKNQPVVIITSDKTTTKFDSNHIISVPYRAGEVIDRLRKIWTSQYGQAQYAFGPYTLNVKEMALVNHQNSTTTPLTDKELDILRLLADLDEPIGKTALLKRLWGFVDTVETHTVETHIYRLRQKIEKDPAEPQYLVTTEGGYFLKN